MDDQIQAVINKAIDENWFVSMTTSDLQGVCMAEAMRILRSQVGNPMFVEQSEVEAISDEILKRIYELEE